MMRTTRTGSSLLARLSYRSFNAPRRSFAVSAVAKADLVQDLYLKELKGYKPTPEKPGDAEAVVHKFNPPAAPQSPEETNLASEMQSYEQEPVEIEGQAAKGETEAPEEDYFEDLKQMEEEQPAAH